MSLPVKAVMKIKEAKLEMNLQSALQSTGNRSKIPAPENSITEH